MSKFYRIFALAMLFAFNTLAVQTARAADKWCPKDHTMPCVEGDFLYYWEANGGLEINGLPLSQPTFELLSDGKRYWVQYFERARFELHPENAGTPYLVQLGQFGRLILGISKDYQALSNAPEPTPCGDRDAITNKCVSGDFLNFWKTKGGLAQFGRPITNATNQKLENGQTYWVQYFERARFELHPENAGTPYYVQLGQFGRAIFDSRGGFKNPYARCEPLQDFKKEPGTWFKLPVGNYVIATIWSNDPKLGDSKMVITPLDTLESRLGGAYWEYSWSCSYTARAAFDNFPKTSPWIATDQLIEKGFLREVK